MPIPVVVVVVAVVDISGILDIGSRSGVAVGERVI